jgi:hypothetical protein
MDIVPFLRESAASFRLAHCPSEHKCDRSAFGPSNLFFSSGQSFSGLLPTVWPIRVRVM